MLMIEPNQEPSTPQDKLLGKSSVKIKKEQGFFIGAKGYKNSIINIVKLMDEDENLKGLWKFNDFIEEIEYAKKPKWNPYVDIGKKIDDRDEIHIKGWLAQQHHFEPSVQLIREALYLYSCSNRVHPVKAYLEPLRWDGVVRL